MKQIIAALIKSYRVDKIAFYFEMIGTFFTIIASLSLAFSAKNPNMLLIFPLYEIGSVTLLISYYRREMIWSSILSSYFVVINIIGFVIAFI